jgi:hypothetical protein
MSLQDRMNSSEALSPFSSLNEETFFEVIGLSDIERIHSQMFQWILSDSCSAMSERNKCNYVSEIFGVPVEAIYGVNTELKSIDILIETDQHILVIENKMKTSQHSNQLTKYESYINENYPSTKKPLFYFLTLIEEGCQDPWRNINYHRIAEVMKTKIELISADGIILNEYNKTIERLSSALKSFINSPDLYINVFRDGSLKKSEKDFSNPELYPTSVSKIIGKNQLETIFQKAYFNAVSTKLELNPNDVYILETRGNAILGFVIERIPYSVENEKIKYFDLGMDYQNGSFKIFVTGTPYNDCSYTNLPKGIDVLMSELKDQYGFNRVNPPSSKAQFSMTKKSNYFQNKTVPKIDEFAIEFETNLEQAKTIIKNHFKPKFMQLLNNFEKNTINKKNFNQTKFKA